MRPATHKSYKTSARSWHPYIADLMIEQISKQHVERFVSDRRGKVMDGTIRNDLAFLASLLRFADGIGHGPKVHPVKAYDKRSLETPEVRVRWLREDQLVELKSKITNPTRWLIVLFGLEAGLRRSEILNLTVSQVDMDENYILLKGTDTKSKRGRRVPISKKLSSALRAHLEAHQKLKPGDWLIVNPDTKKPYEGVRPWWPNALRAAKIMDFTFHDTRHHFATSYVKKGGRQEALQRHLGHKTMAMTGRYAHLAESDAELEFRRLDDPKRRIKGGNK